jgi:hypothetical protein
MVFSSLRFFFLFLSPRAQRRARKSDAGLLCVSCASGEPWERESETVPFRRADRLPVRGCEPSLERKPKQTREKASDRGRSPPVSCQAKTRMPICAPEDRFTRVLAASSTSAPRYTRKSFILSSIGSHHDFVSTETVLFLQKPKTEKNTEKNRSPSRAAPF